MRLCSGSQEAGQRGAYPGLVPEPASCSAGFGLSLCDQLPSGTGARPSLVKSPRSSALIGSAQYLFRETFDKFPQNVKDEERLHHVEIVQMGDDEQVVALLPSCPLLYTVSNLLTTALQKVGAHLMKSSKHMTASEARS